MDLLSAGPALDRSKPWIWRDDTFYHVSSYLMKDLDDSHEIPTLLKEHYEKGELGVKTKKGFYDYSNGKDKEATERRNEKLLKVFNVLYKTL